MGWSHGQPSRGALLLGLLVAIGCGGEAQGPSSLEGGTDGAVDASGDAGVGSPDDAGRDAWIDSGMAPADASRDATASGDGSMGEPPDGSVDASSPDGSVDASSPDGSADASSPDGSPDGATPQDAGGDAGAVCGDGELDPGEVCDDGNQISGDGCSADCQSNEECGNGIVDTAVGEQCDDGSETASCDADCSFAECGDGTRNATAGEECDDGDNQNGDGCDAQCQTESCDSSVDGDFDGSDECSDCDDTDGAIFPGQTEICNGLDDDCDGSVDEGFDMDGDGFGTCTTDPALKDCDDNSDKVYPGATERCGMEGTGNGIDDDCDGYTDETCRPCDDDDGDGDGVTECEGDCNDENPNVSPLKEEVCDGLDTDCNVRTTENCDVSDPCDFPEGTDECKDDLRCFCHLQPDGSCTDYQCFSFCQGSFTGPIGAGCTDSQTCTNELSHSANVHACSEHDGTLGDKQGGADCEQDAECRSGRCQTPISGATGSCADLCDHHAPGEDGSCAEGAACQIRSDNVTASGTCESGATGKGIGESCGDSVFDTCLWGVSACVDGVCAPPCGMQSHCPDGYHCSFYGNDWTDGTWDGGPAGGATQTYTVPVCLQDGSGSHARPAGAACSSNGDCASEFCDSMRNVCVEPCTTDDRCPEGLTCELQYVRTRRGATRARICVNTTRDAVWEPM